MEKQNVTCPKCLAEYVPEQPEGLFKLNGYHEAVTYYQPVLDHLRGENEQFSKQLALLSEQYNNSCKENNDLIQLVSKYESALQQIAVSKRTDGTYNRDREACEQLDLKQQAVFYFQDKLSKFCPADKERPTSFEVIMFEAGYEQATKDLEQITKLPAHEGQNQSQRIASNALKGV